jgi:hypothetical protein
MFKTIAALAAPLLIFSGLLLAETAHQHTSPSPSSTTLTVDQKITDADILLSDRPTPASPRQAIPVCPTGQGIPCGSTCCYSNPSPGAPPMRCCVSAAGQSYCAQRC